MFEVDVGYVLPEKFDGFGINEFRSSLSVGSESEESHSIACCFRTDPASVVGNSSSGADRWGGVL